MSYDFTLAFNMALNCQLSPAVLSSSLSAGVSSFPVGQEKRDTPTCGYQSCHPIKPTMSNVHSVPHTHDDVGWSKTVDQYFYGDRNDIQHAGVQYISDSVVDQSLKNPDRRFIYVETGFFYRWWKQQSSSTQQTVKQSVDEGRSEFVNGGWCMSDEATTHYSAVIDQMTIGSRFLNDTFGICGRPRVAWHIDPFGHAREHASMFAQMGYDGFFFGRSDYQDRSRRMKAKEQELLWRASDSLPPPMADLFTGISPNGYNPPAGFCWDMLCDDAPIRDDPELEDYNVDDVVQRFLQVAKSQALVYKTNHIIMTMGSDFQYENANSWYKNLDKSIRYVNAQQANGSNVNSLYSTPSCYSQESHRANLTWALKTDDFFPYADNAHNFWTGYFTSRPASKRYERVSNSNLQSCNQSEVSGGPVSRKGSFGQGDSETLRKAMAVAQHHDAVSGTEKQHVANDYAKRLANGWQHCKVLVSNSLASLTGSSAERIYCDNLNVSVCPLTESGNKFSVTVYNPSGRVVTWPVRSPVNGTSYSVTDAQSKPVDCQVLPVSRATQDVRRNRGYASNESVFQVQAPPSGYSVYSVSSIKAQQSSSLPQSSVPTVIQNKFLQVTFDPDTGLLTGLSNSETKQTIKSSQNFYWYNASNGNNHESRQTSGAYIFRPNSSTPIMVNNKARVESFQNSVVQEVRQWFSPWVSQVVRLYADSKAVESEWTVGPVPVNDGQGKEVITRSDTDIKTSEFFYTDSNGREVSQRKKDFRPTWQLKQTEPIAGNYYPINSRAFIKDDTDQLTVVTDRSQGGASIYNGSSEIMLHRRSSYDDYRGVDEASDERSEIFPDGSVVRGRLLLSLERPASAADAHRPSAQEMVWQPSSSFTDGDSNPNTRSEFSGLQASSPPAVHLSTSSRWDEESVSSRSEHQFQSWESKSSSQPVTVNSQKSFSTSDVSGVSESNLSANQWKEKMRRFDWTPEKEKPSSKTFEDPSVWEITSRPMEIRTFLLRVTFK